MDNFYETGPMFLVYRDSEGSLYSQNWEDLASVGTLIDPDSDEDLELIGWSKTV